MDESAVHGSTSTPDIARFWEVREGGDSRSGASSEPIMAPNKLLQIRGEDFMAEDLLGGEIISEEAAEYQMPP
ncbi:hypothetical protein LIER_23612 [Lithospermum erythrorhizon]|uniref:Uncharacterized protein n=1 Tax=Lithospermum erythrorhizon TaxID=34254 RepID=A0AAV3R1B1_LITER